MPYYHVSISTRNWNLEEKDRGEGVVRVISENYNVGKEFLFDGRWVSPIDIQEIHIISTESPSNRYSSVFLRHQDDVTRLWIQKRPQKTQGGKTKRHQEALGKNVFIVHGRDHEPMKELKTMLLEFSLNPIVLHEQPSGSRTIVEKLEEYSNVGYAFVILTPDDIGGTFKGKAPVLGNGDIKNVDLRARQNVILEFGYFMGLLGRERVCCLYKGGVELPSDMHGIVYVPFEKSVEEKRIEIMKELDKASYETKI